MRGDLFQVRRAIEYFSLFQRVSGFPNLLPGNSIDPFPSPATMKINFYQRQNPKGKGGGKAMSDYVLFQIWEPSRQSLIAGQLFYVDQAKKRLLSQFEDIETEAKKAAEDWLKRNLARFDPDRHDPSDFYEAANDVGIEFYMLQSDMREQTRLSVVAGMFHEWDKQVRAWLVREIQHWNHGNDIVCAVWKADFKQIANLFESMSWPICSTNYFRALDACRLVVNVYKHGEGMSLDDLKKRFPEYLDDPLCDKSGAPSDLRYRNHTHLKVSEEQFQAFSDAIVAFWRAVPGRISESNVKEIPDWFGKAIKKDHSS